MSYKLTKGPKFALQRKRAATDLTHDMLQRFVTTSLSCTRILQYFYIQSTLLSCHPWIRPALTTLRTLCCLQASLEQTVVQPHQACPSTYRCSIGPTSCIGPFIVPYWSQEKFQQLVCTDSTCPMPDATGPTHAIVPVCLLHHAMKVTSTH